MESKVKIIGYDIAKSGSDCAAIRFCLPSNYAGCPKVGEDFPLTKWELRRYGLPEDAKLTVMSIHEHDGIPYMTALVR